MHKKIAGYSKELLAVFYPEFCPCCDELLLRFERHICTWCEFQMPYFRYAEEGELAMLNRLKGRLSMPFGFSLFPYKKGSRVQKLLYNLKYKNKPQVGVHFGKELAKRNYHTLTKNPPDLIIPIPLHPKKEFMRGYNQAHCIAEGLGLEIGSVEIGDNALKRNSNSSSQTNKSRMNRWENVKSVFQITEPDVIYGKKILLLDDVITTGSTLEAAGLTLLNGGAKSVACGTLAIATV